MVIQSFNRMYASPNTPLKLQMEYNHGCSVRIIFFSKLVISRFRRFIFQGVKPLRCRGCSGLRSWGPQDVRYLINYLPDIHSSPGPCKVTLLQKDNA